MLLTSLSTWQTGSCLSLDALTQILLFQINLLLTSLNIFRPQNNKNRTDIYKTAPHTISFTIEWTNCLNTKCNTMSLGPGLTQASVP